MTKIDDKRVPALRFKGFNDDWAQHKFNEIGSFYYGKSAPKWSIKGNGNIPCVRYGEMYTKFEPKIDHIYSYTTIDPKKLKFSSGHELLIPRVGEDPLDFGKHCSWLAVPNVAIGEMISVFNSKENPLFLAYYIRAKLVYKFASRVEGGNVSNLYFERLEKLALNVPATVEQEKIVRILEKLNNLLSLQQRKLEQLKQIKKAYLKTIFSQNLSTCYLKDIAEYRRGSFPQPYTNREWYGGKNSQPFVQVADVGENLKLNSKTKETISVQAQPNSVFVPKDTILVTLQGSIGRVAITQYDSYVDRTLLIITKLKKQIDKYYLAYALQEKFNEEKRKAPGGTIKTITKSALSSFQIIVPSYEKQLQQSNILKKMDNEIELSQNKLKETNSLKQFFLQNMFI